MEKSISPIAFLSVSSLYAHKIVEFSEAFEEDTERPVFGYISTVYCGFQIL